MAREVLCTLSMTPIPGPIIADDLGLIGRKPSLRDCIHILRGLGIEIETQRQDGAITYAIAPKGWRHARAEAQAYWSKVYEQKTVPAAK